MQYALPPSGAGCVQRGNVDADIALLESLLAIPEQDTADFVANLEQLTQSNPALGDRVNREAKNATEQVEDTLQKQDLLVAIGIDRLHRSRLYALVCRVALRYKRSQGSTFRAMVSWSCRQRATPRLLHSAHVCPRATLRVLAFPRAAEPCVRYTAGFAAAGPQHRPQCR